MLYLCAENDKLILGRFVYPNNKSSMQTNTNNSELRQCRKPSCLKWLPKSEFYKNGERKDGLQVYCKACCSSASKQRRQKNKSLTPEELQVKQMQLYPDGLKFCPKCKEKKKLNCFKSDPGAPGGVRGHCITCTKDQSSEYRQILIDRSYAEIFSDMAKQLNLGNTPIEQAIKKCSRTECSQVKPLTEFTLERGTRCGVSAECKSCIVLRIKEHNERSRAERNEFLEGGCESCGYRNNGALEACHTKRSLKARDRNGKPVQPCKLTGKSFRAESEHMYVLCVVCHRLETQEENGVNVNPRVRQKQAFVNAEKLRRGCCTDCKMNVVVGGDDDNTVAFDFDHLPGQVKVEGISRMVNLQLSEDIIAAEMIKCELVCANCHRLRTTARGTRWYIPPQVSVLDHYMRFQAGLELPPVRSRVEHHKQNRLTLQIDATSSEEV
jgi:hypothetical protein